MTTTTRSCPTERRASTSRGTAALIALAQIAAVMASATVFAAGDESVAVVEHEGARLEQEGAHVEQEGARSAAVTAFEGPVAGPAVVAGSQDGGGATLVTRTWVVFEQRSTPLSPDQLIWESPIDPVGRMYIAQAGAPGVRSDTYAVTFVAGVRTAERIVSSDEVAPRPEVVVVGTSNSVAASKNWAALADCESGGDPTIVSASGRYHGLYQFAVSTWEAVGGVGLPSQATPQEQTLRAMRLYEISGSSPWPVCGSRL